VSPNSVYEISLSDADWSLRECDDFDVCQIVYRFSWHHDRRGEVRALPLDLPGHPCSDYGLALDFGGPGAALPRVAEVCHSGRVYHGELTGMDDQFSLISWRLKGKEQANTTAKVLLWVTQDGRLPAQRGDATANRDLIRRLLEGSHSGPILPLNGSSAISHVAVYAVRVNSSSSSACSQERCIVGEVQLRHYSTPRCRLNFICPQWPSDLCSDHGLTLNADGTSQAVCREAIIYNATLSAASIQAWVARNATFPSGATCYLWCTPDGRLPAHRPRVDHSRALEEMSATSVRAVPITADPPNRPLCQRSVHKIEANDSVLNSFAGPTRGSLRYYSLTFAWYAPYDTTLHILTSDAGEDPCATRGIQLTLGRGREEFLCGRQLWSGSLSQGDVANLTLWFREGEGEFDTEIYLWAKEGAGLPEPGGRAVDAAVVRALVKERWMINQHIM